MCALLIWTCAKVVFKNRPVVQLSKAFNFKIHRRKTKNATSVIYKLLPWKVIVAFLETCKSQVQVLISTTKCRISCSGEISPEVMQLCGYAVEVKNLSKKKKLKRLSEHLFRKEIIMSHLRQNKWHFIWYRNWGCSCRRQFPSFLCVAFQCQPEQKDK